MNEYFQNNNIGHIHQKRTMKRGEKNFQTE